MFGKLFGKKKLNQRQFLETLPPLFEDTSELLLKNFNIDKELWFKCKPEIKLWLFTIASNTFHKSLNKKDKDTALQFISNNIIFSSIDLDLSDKSQHDYAQLWWKERSNFYQIDNMTQSHFSEEFYKILFETPMMTNAELEDLPIEFDAMKKMERSSRGSSLINDVMPGFMESLTRLINTTQF